MLIKTHILTLLFVISISSAKWDTFAFKKTDVTSYSVQEEKTNANSPIVCASHCANKFLCQGMVYDDSNCKLVTDVIIGTGGSEKVYLVNQIRGKVVGIRVKTSESPGSGWTVKTDLCGEDKQCCHMKDFDNPGTDLNHDVEFDLYQNGGLLGCENFPLQGFKSMKLEYVGDNSWLGQWIKIILESPTDFHYHCEIKDWMNDGSIMDLDCKWIASPPDMSSPPIGQF